MSTRGRIGIVREDGTVESIYSHSDNYPSYVGNMLLHHYTDEGKVKALIALGDISVLDERLEPDPKGGKVRKLVRGKDGYRWRTVNAHGVHRMMERQEGVTLAYGRDCGDTGLNDNDGRIDRNVDEFRKGDIEEWGYLYRDGKWYVIDGHLTRRRLVPLTDETIAKYAKRGD